MTSGVESCAFILKSTGAIPGDSTEFNAPVPLRSSAVSVSVLDSDFPAVDSLSAKVGDDDRTSGTRRGPV